MKRLVLIRDEQRSGWDIYRRPLPSCKWYMERLDPYKGCLYGGTGDLLYIQQKVLVLEKG